MRRRWRAAFLAGVSLALLLPNGCALPSPPQSSPTLHSLALRRSDLLPQSTPDSARFWTNAQVARRDRVPVATYRRHGRLLSYQDSFARHIINGSGSIWLLHADSEITAFQDVAGAHWYYDHLHATIHESYVLSTNNLGANVGQTGIRVPFHRAAVPPIGETDAGFTADSEGDEMGYTTRVILFRRDRYVVLLRIRGLLDQTAMGKVVAVARRIDARVKATG